MAINLGKYVSILHTASLADLLASTSARGYNTSAGSANYGELREAMSLVEEPTRESLIYVANSHWHQLITSGEAQQGSVLVKNACGHQADDYFDGDGERVTWIDPYTWQSDTTAPAQSRPTPTAVVYIPTAFPTDAKGTILITLNRIQGAVEKLGDPISIDFLTIGGVRLRNVDYEIIALPPGVAADRETETPVTYKILVKQNLPAYRIRINLTPSGSGNITLQGQRVRGVVGNIYGVTPIPFIDEIEERAKAVARAIVPRNENDAFTFQWTWRGGSRIMAGYAFETYSEGGKNARDFEIIEFNLPVGKILQVVLSNLTKDVVHFKAHPDNKGTINIRPGSKVVTGTWGLLGNKEKVSTTGVQLSASGGTAVFVKIQTWVVPVLASSSTASPDKIDMEISKAIAGSREHYHPMPGSMNRKAYADKSMVVASRATIKYIESTKVDTELGLQPISHQHDLGWNTIQGAIHGWTVQYSASGIVQRNFNADEVHPRAGGTWTTFIFYIYGAPSQWPINQVLVSGVNEVQWEFYPHSERVTEVHAYAVLPDTNPFNVQVDFATQQISDTDKIFMTDIFMVPGYRDTVAYWAEESVVEFHSSTETIQVREGNKHAMPDERDKAYTDGRNTIYYTQIKLDAEPILSNNLAFLEERPPSADPNQKDGGSDVATMARAVSVDNIVVAGGLVTSPSPGGTGQAYNFWKGGVTSENHDGRSSVAMNFIPFRRADGSGLLKLQGEINTLAKSALGHDLTAEAVDYMRVEVTDFNLSMSTSRDESRILVEVTASKDGYTYNPQSPGLPPFYNSPQSVVRRLSEQFDRNKRAFLFINTQVYAVGNDLPRLRTIVPYDFVPSGFRYAGGAAFSSGSTLHLNSNVIRIPYQWVRGSSGFRGQVNGYLYEDSEFKYNRGTPTLTYGFNGRRPHENSSLIEIKKTGNTTNQWYLRMESLTYYNTAKIGASGLIGSHAQYALIVSQLFKATQYDASNQPPFFQLTAGLPGSRTYEQIRNGGSVEGYEWKGSLIGGNRRTPIGVGLEFMMVQDYQNNPSLASHGAAEKVISRFNLPGTIAPTMPAPIYKAWINAPYNLTYRLVAGVKLDKGLPNPYHKGDNE